MGRVYFQVWVGVFNCQDKDLFRYLWHCGKKQIEYSVVWSVLLSTTIRVITVVKICCVSLSIRVHTTLNHIRLVNSLVFGFHITASGPKQCNLCMENDAVECKKNQQTATCATDRLSFGTSHCGSAIGRYTDNRGQPSIVYLRGCINCAGREISIHTFTIIMSKCTEISSKA